MSRSYTRNASVPILFAHFLRCFARFARRFDSICACWAVFSSSRRLVLDPLLKFANLDHDAEHRVAGRQVFFLNENLLGDFQFDIREVPDRFHAGADERVRRFLREGRRNGEDGQLDPEVADLHFHSVQGHDGHAMNEGAYFLLVLIEGSHYIESVELEFLIAHEG